MCDNHMVACGMGGGCAFHPRPFLSIIPVKDFREVFHLDLFTPGLFPGANSNLDVGAN